MPLDESTVANYCNEAWEGIVPILHEYIAIPNVSPDFDPRWRENGHMAKAVDLISGWCRDRPIPGLTVEVLELDVHAVAFKAFAQQPARTGKVLQKGVQAHPKPRRECLVRFVAL